MFGIWSVSQRMFLLSIRVSVTSPLRSSPYVSDLPLTTGTCQGERGSMSSFVQSWRKKLATFWKNNLDASCVLSTTAGVWITDWNKRDTSSLENCKVFVNGYIFPKHTFLNHFAPSGQKTWKRLLCNLGQESVNNDSWSKSNLLLLSIMFYWNLVMLIFVLSVAAFMLQRQSWAVVTEQSLKYLLSGLSQKNLPTSVQHHSNSKFLNFSAIAIGVGHSCWGLTTTTTQCLHRAFLILKKKIFSAMTWIHFSFSF